MAVNVTDPLKREWEHFISYINNRQDPLTDSGHGLNVVRVPEAGQGALDRGGITGGVEDIP